MSEPVPLLSVNAIEAVYGGAIVALNGVSLTVAAGEIVALLGPNGAGKSTTLKAISNLLPAQRGRLSAGTIRFDNVDVNRHSASALVRRGLVQVLEGRHCFRSLSTEDNLVTGGLARGSNRSELARDLERVYSIFPRLREKRKTIAGLTSGGEQQMTAIGRALMSRPRLLVLDEPSMGLAPLVVQDIFERLTALNASEGLSILLAEQNTAVALRHAHRAVLLASGRSVLQGRAAELRGRADLTDIYLGRTSFADSSAVSTAA
ncbi:ABC transporter ATP-binding protein [Labrys sp. WJW]|uniref:ABC transporter ATP-binding protein n=1 Tax=Labrys sp. WJW TaxID=1737983 RepID=UPI00083457C3|nr:ABC transporter ATP-binding protein [Labrys sp. WJW]OCC00690.1 ABC transporter ATP-binding protein [Labrys sp. WJW]